MAVRNHPRVGPGVPIVVAIEAQGSEAEFMAPTFEYCDNDLLVMREFHDDGCFGVPKNGNVLVGLIGTTQALLTRNLVSIPGDAIVHSTRFSKECPTMRDHRETLAKQFGAFRMNTHMGKINGKENGANDDIIIAFMMSLYWMTRFSSRNLPLYMVFRDRYPRDIWFNSLAHNLCMKEEIQRRGEETINKTKSRHIET